MGRVTVNHSLFQNTNKFVGTKSTLSVRKYSGLGLYSPMDDRNALSGATSAKASHSSYLKLYDQLSGC